MTFAT